MTREWPPGLFRPPYHATNPKTTPQRSTLRTEEQLHAIQRRIVAASALWLRTLLHEHHVRAVGVDPTIEKETGRLARAAALGRLAVLDDR
jgi:hypothetical protein